ncbi:3-oxoacyl-ACP synthase III family protein [Actinokineospora sp. NBRC 105648]|uniref:3-oxoacyl-ACP synthase III family protein n=1 Tax=Actinokineospora sp. NBRC 105648 TaxID=3032206 RepID=UPI0024A58F77|nr:3-oxoacyl-ACP synthase III family protein [Actinokineospora sp. NBRC 105648]GLZ40809.1 3-oxoacyl-[acyl-carrier-protein] synthase III [Actinokineospora sp. NBRC 105648]
MGAKPVRVLSVGTALPGPPVDTAALAARFGMNRLWEQWVDTFIGTRSRHLAVDLETGRQRHTLADLGETAAREAIADARLSTEDIDVVVLGTATPDELMPTTVNVVADRLRIDGVPTFQLQSGCSGAVQTFDVASALLGTGAYRTALVIGGDVIARHYDVSADLHAVPPEELVNYVLFGDGAGAAVLTTEEDADAPVVRRVLTRLTGLDREPGQVLRWFGLVDRASAQAPAREDYKAIEESVPVMAREVADELLDDLGWKREEVDYLLPPQLSVAMTAKITAGLDFPGAREVSCVADIGNNGNALLFFQLRRLLAEMRGPARAIAVAIESSKWIKSGLALETL